MKFTKATVLIIVLSFAIGCGRHNPDLRLVEIEGLSDTDPSLALTRLDSIDRESLDEYNRHYYDFLKIKESDKAYTVHTSDSLYLSVLDYFNSRKSDPLYPEVLYYGGRVYSDIGDYPLAMTYYQDCLDFLERKDNYQDLKIRALSQYSKIFDDIKLFDRALELEKEALSISESGNDTLSIVQTLQIIGVTYLRMHERDSALSYLKNSIKRSGPNIEVSTIAKSNIYIGHLLEMRGETDSAVNLVEENLDKIKPSMKSTSLAYAIDIYLKAGLKDRALEAIYELINSKYPANKRIGYKALLTNDFSDKVEIDTLVSYINGYTELLQKDYDENNAELAMMQESYYNYRIRERELMKEQETNRQLWIIIGMTLLVASLLAVWVLFLLNQKNKKQIQVYDTIVSLPEKREELRDKLLALIDRGEKKEALSTEILNSAVYNEIKDYSSKGISILNNEKVWEKIKNLFNTNFPDFKENLIVLTKGGINEEELQTAYLIKLRFRPTQICGLLNRSRSGINSRRQEIGKKIFDKKMDIRTVDTLIKNI